MEAEHDEWQALDRLLQWSTFRRAGVWHCVTSSRFVWQTGHGFWLHALIELRSHQQRDSLGVLLADLVEPCHRVGFLNSSKR
jgi:hypothetical protein